MVASNKKVIFLINLLVPYAWIWGLYHCQAGEKSAWVFPIDAYSGIEFCGMVLEDWLFYPITINFFTTMIIFDPLKKSIKIPLSKRTERVLREILYLFLWAMALWSFYIFGNSGKATTIFFVVPAIIIFPYVWCSWDISRFLRTGLIVVPMEFIWDHWAVGRHQQWLYVQDSNIWGGLWFNGIPIEMTPYLGFAAWYFNFAIVLWYSKLLGEKSV